MTPRRDPLPNRLKAGYAAGARGTGRVLRRLGLLPQAPPPAEHRWRHWAFSLTAAQDFPALAALDVPWWTYRSIDAVAGWLAARPGPIRVFEYGAGASTLWLAARAEEVVSVEHDTAFARLLAGPVGERRNIELVVVPPEVSEHPAVPSAKGGCAGLDFSRYADAVTGRGTFDLIVIDGRARQACLERSLPQLRQDGLIVFDNSARRRYRPAIAAAGVDEISLRGLTPTLPYPEQTSLLRRRAAP